MFEIKRYDALEDAYVTIATFVTLVLARAFQEMLLVTTRPPVRHTIIVDAEGVDVREYAPECHEEGSKGACECFCAGRLLPNGLYGCEPCGFITLEDLEERLYGV